MTTTHNVTTITDLENIIIDWCGGEAPTDEQLERAVDALRPHWDPATGTLVEPDGFDLFEVMNPPTPETIITIYDGRQHGGGTRWDARFFFAHGCPRREDCEALHSYAGRVARWAIGSAMDSGAYEDESEIELTVRVEDGEDDVTVEVVG